MEVLQLMRYLVTKTASVNTAFYAIFDGSDIIYYDYVRIDNFEVLTDFLKAAADNYSVDTILVQTNGLGVAVYDFLTQKDSRVKEVHYTNELRDREQEDYGYYLNKYFTFENITDDLLKHYFHDLACLYLNFLGQNFIDTFM